MEDFSGNVEAVEAGFSHCFPWFYPMIPIGISWVSSPWFFPNFLIRLKKSDMAFTGFSHVFPSKFTVDFDPNWSCAEARYLLLRVPGECTTATTDGTFGGAVVVVVLWEIFLAIHRDDFLGGLTCFNHQTSFFCTCVWLFGGNSSTFFFGGVTIKQYVPWSK